ncbi:MAG: ImmA/IrrE family metallo-endopeptidase [Chloroflexota bacterium]|nr:ImmA/IrrE family metallo-endopeptidase [Chloroflexota bacterium]
MKTRWVRDTSGRFPERPHYVQADLDAECERVIRDFLVARHGALLLPVPTDDLIRLIERDAQQLDIYADLRDEGPNVEGLTIFEPGMKPTVHIAKELSEDTRRVNRFRTTLTHEFGHVHLHAFVFNMEKPKPMFPEQDDEPWRRQLARVAGGAIEVSDNRQRCKRDTIEEASEYDWMEWQAGYACGALLMPIATLTERVGQLKSAMGILGPAQANSPDGRRLVAAIASEFEVSLDAARVRLTKLNHLTAQQTGVGFNFEVES